MKARKKRESDHRQPGEPGKPFQRWPRKYQHGKVGSDPRYQRRSEHDAEKNLQNDKRYVLPDYRNAPYGEWNGNQNQRLNKKKRNGRHGHLAQSLNTTKHVFRTKPDV